MRKKFWASVLIFSMVLSLLPAGASAAFTGSETKTAPVTEAAPSAVVTDTLVLADYEPNLSDLSDAPWAEASILRWTGYGVVSGMSSGFYPNGEMTRAQAAHVFAKLLGLEDAPISQEYYDLPDDAWYSASIRKCYNAGIMNGVSPHMMDPDSILTREQFFVMFARALKLEEQPTTSGEPADGNSWSAGYINALTDRNYVRGDGTGVNALSSITRASVMTLLDQTISTYANVPGETVTGTGEGVILVAADDITITGSTQDVVVAEGASGADGSATVTLSDATVAGQLSVTATTELLLTGVSSVDALVVTEQAAGTTVEVSENATVGVLSSDASDTSVSGSGTVTAVEGSVIDTTTGTSADDTTDTGSGSTGGSSSTGGYSGGGYSGGGSDGPVTPSGPVSLTLPTASQTVVTAPLHDNSNTYTDEQLKVSGTYALTTTGTAGSTIDLSFDELALRRHRAGGDAGYGYWVGIGVPQASGFTLTYAVGSGSYVENAVDFVTAASARDGEWTYNEITYDTFYFDAGTLTSGYVAVRYTQTNKPSNAATLIYWLSFANVKPIYSVTFKNEDGTTLQTVEAVSGAAPVYSGELPTKAATAQYSYSFDGWSPEIISVTDNATYTATFSSTVNEYTIEFVNEDGTELQSSSVAYGATPSYDGETPTKAATAQYSYSFDGWSPEIISVTDNATYTATFSSTVNEYTIKFVDEDGTELQSSSVAYGATPSYTGEVPTKAADAQYTYSFAGWSPEITSVTGNATYTATFSSTVNEYTIKFVNEDGTELQSSSVAYGAMPSYTDSTPTRAATAQYTYSFAGWSPAIQPVTGDATYTAQFDSTVNQYSVTFVDEDGTELQSSSVAYGATPSYTGSTPTRAATAQYSYSFAGWSDGTTIYASGGLPTVTGDATYTATFSNGTNSYTITWQMDDGSTIDTTTVAYGETPTHSTPTKAATAQYTYTFTGWSPAIESVTGNATYTAQFDSTVNEYTVTFVNADGTELQSSSVAYGATPSYTGEVPTKAADAQYTYSFAGWLPEITSVTDNATYTATFSSTVNEYTIKFVNEDGTELQSSSVAYGATPSYTGETPTKAADAQYTYSFTGWTPAIESVTGDATYTATFSNGTNSYTITWQMDDGSTIDTTTVAYGETPTHSIPTKAVTAQYAYTFTGWSPAIQPVTGGATYTAQFTSTLRTYTVTWKNKDDSTLATDENVLYGTIPSYLSGTMVPTYTDPTGQFTYTFSGWTPAFTPVDGDRVYTAQYTAATNTYTITWKDDEGNILFLQQLAYGETPNYDGTPTKAADEQYTYTFSSWDREIVSVTGDATYTARFTPTLRTYTVTWKNYNGETLETDTGVDYGATPSYDGVAPVRADDVQYTYTFTGWSPAITSVTGDAVYFASYTPTERTYTVRFLNADGSELSTAQYAYGTAAADIVKPTNSTKADDVQYTYTFNDWTPAITDVTGNAAYFATYIQTERTYTVTFVDEDGTTVLKAAAAYSYGTAANDIAKPADPAKTSTAEHDYAFAGWSDGTGTYPSALPGVTHDVTYTATYSETLRSYTITWNVNGTTSTTNVAYGTVPSYDGETPTKAGDAAHSYTFTGWDPAIVAVTGEATYTAQFAEAGNTFTVTFDSDGGSAVASQTVSYGSSVTEPAEPTRTGYTFGGWYVDETAYAFGTAVTSNITLTAKWNINTYTVTWKNGDTVLETDENVAYGTAPSYDGATPTKTDATASYVFIGWNNGTATYASGSLPAVTGDAAYTAVFSNVANNYAITWLNDDGTLIDTAMVTHGTVPTHADPSKAADAQYTYAFAGWKDEDNHTYGKDEALPAATANATYKATYTSTVNTYTVKFLNEGGTELQSGEVGYGTVPAYTGETPAKTATAEHTYTFSGWKDESGNTYDADALPAVTGDAIYTAQFADAATRYTVAWSIDGVETTETYAYGATPTHADPVKADGAGGQKYRFTGWSPAIGTVTGDVAYTAQFVEVYTVTWLDGDGNTLKTETVDKSTTPSYSGTTPTKTPTAEHSYTFNNTWTPAIVPVTGNATYTAQFDSTVNTYTVTFLNYDGTQLHSDAYAYGSDVSTIANGLTPTIPAADGYTYAFAGWSPTITADTSVTANQTYYALITGTTLAYNVTFYSNGGTVSRNVTDYVYGVGALLPTQAEASRPGYIFSGWYENEELTGTAVTSISTADTGDKTFYAKWTPIEVATAKLHDNAGTSAIADANLYNSYSIEALGSSVGADFWYALNVSDLAYHYNAEGMGGYWAGFAVLAPDGAAGYSYAVSVDSVTAPTSAPLPLDEKADGTHSGFALYADLGSAAQFSCYVALRWYDASDNALTGVTVYYVTADGHWSPNTYTVTLDANGGTADPASITVACGKTYDGLSNPTREGYTFDGWYTAAEGGTRVTGDTKVTETVAHTLYAHWTIHTYTVTFNSDGGSSVDPQTVEHGSKATAPTAPTRDGYTFLGWYNGETLYDFNTTVTGNITLTANWQQNYYTVTWQNEDGTVLETDTNVPHGTTPSYDGATPTKAATAQYTYTFSGWTPTVSAASADVTYTATYTSTVNTYTVTFVNEDGTILGTDVDVEYGATPTYNGVTPTKAATAQYTYTFAGWSPAVAAVTGDATYTATYTSTVNTYTVTWKNYDGTVLETDENVEYGTTPSYDGETPAKAADAQYTYTFAGWSPAVVTVTGDATYTATYTSTVNKYTIKFVDEDGTTVLREAVSYDYGTVETDIEKPADPTKAATEQYTYTFSGWTPEITTVTGNATYTATYTSTVNKYTVTFDPDGGTVTPASITVEYGRTYGELPTPTLTGYTFTGWWRNGGLVSANTVTLSHDHALAAGWSPVMYTAIWKDADGGQLHSKANVKITDTPVYDGADPVKASTAEIVYTFSDWERTVDHESTTITYTPVFTESARTYTITFVNDDGTTVLQSSEVAYGTTPSYTGATPTKAATNELAYTFSDWTPEITTVTGEATYTATYTESARKFTVTFDSDGGSEVASQEVQRDTAASKPTDPTRTGYTFGGWYTDAACTAAYDFGTLVTADVTLTAKWTANTYTVTLDPDGGQFANPTDATRSVQYGATYGSNEDPLPVPTRDSSLFVGWFTNFATGSEIKDDTIVATSSDHMLYARWVASRTVTFVSNGGSEVTAQTIARGTNAEEPDGPTRDGYAFAGWYADVALTTPYSFDTPVMDDITLYAKWVWASEYALLSMAQSYLYDPGYSYHGIFSIENGTVSYSISATDATKTENETTYIVADLARFLGALYRVDSINAPASIIYKNDTYTWHEELAHKGSNWAKASEITLVSAIVANQTLVDAVSNTDGAATISVTLTFSLDTSGNALTISGITASSRN